MLTRTSSVSLTSQLAQRYAERIKSRLMAPGSRLPSVRQCAKEQGVSAYTVVAAYDQLLAQGLVEARKQRGFFVRETPVYKANLPHPGVNAKHIAIKSIAFERPEAEQFGLQDDSQAHAQDLGRAVGTRRFDATALIRGMFHQSQGRATLKAQPGMGVFPPDWLESTFMPAAVRRVTQTTALNGFSLQYGEPMGDSSLRRALSTKLATLAIAAPPEQIITTIGATHALDVVSRTLLKAGDAVMVEEPGWAVEFARLEALGMRVLPVPRTPEGPDLAVMQRYCEHPNPFDRPKLFVSVSVFHNPTGACLKPHAAHRVLQLAQQHNFWVVEDDTYSHLAPEGSTRMSALDGLQRTIYVSGFAKILAPNWRVGFLAAPAHCVERLLDTKLLATLTTPALLERALALCIEQGQLRRHAERVRTRLEAARARSVKLALQHGCSFAAQPAGLFGWVDTGVDTEQLALRMLDMGYLLAPGTLFHAARAPSTLMRINFATTQDAAFWKLFAKLRDAMA
jgi:DNA-binding transcriptional MocR family regulator